MIQLRPYTPAIAVWQPWAALIAAGVKRFETRAQRWAHRGPVVIYAARRWTRAQWEICRTPGLAAALDLAGLRVPEAWGGAGVTMPFILGGPAAIARLIACHEVVEVLGVAHLRNARGFVRPVPYPELALGDFRPGRFAYELEAAAPVFAPGLLPDGLDLAARQGVFRPPLAVLEAINAQLAGVA